MPPRIKKNSTRQIAGEVRRSQLVSTYGPGALVDFQNISGVMNGIDKWNIEQVAEEDRLREHNLERLLDKQFFIQPQSRGQEGATFLSVSRFPTMYYCPQCHMLDKASVIGKPLNESSKECTELLCNKCSTGQLRVRLVPARFVAACPNGHLEDFPWSWWVHRQKPHHGGIPQLSLEYDANRGGLDGIVVKCSCGAQTTMAGCMGKEALRELACKGISPWLSGNQEPCGAKMRTVQRGANNVYYSVCQSALTIPPWSSRVQKFLKKYAQHLAAVAAYPSEIQSQTLLLHWEDKQAEYNCSQKKFLEEFSRTYRPLTGAAQDITAEKILEDEYTAFCGNDADDCSFRMVQEPVPDTFAEVISKVGLVKCLREVVVLKGFRRIFPEYEQDGDKRQKEGLYDREVTPISEAPLPWLPAVELFGEGIFIALHETPLKVWEQHASSRYGNLGKRLAPHSWIGKGMFSPVNPRYILLHTLAHLLIRQLSFGCGYSTSSLKEKIYSTALGSTVNMAGILIYTASPDSDGSLGGLVRQGKSANLANIIMAALQKASWCSNDPVCIGSTAQGYNGLNHAACHACTLLPETSCEAVNCLLDRAAIVGTQEDRTLGFFSRLVWEAQSND